MEIWTFILAILIAVGITVRHTFLLNKIQRLESEVQNKQFLIETYEEENRRLHERIEGVNRANE